VIAYTLKILTPLGSLTVAVPQMVAGDIPDHPAEFHLYRVYRSPVLVLITDLITLITKYLRKHGTFAERVHNVDINLGAFKISFFLNPTVPAAIVYPVELSDSVHGPKTI